MKNSLLAKKSLDQLSREASSEASGLRRVLGPWHLIFLGVGAIVGAGIFVITGHAAKHRDIMACQLLDVMDHSLPIQQASIRSYQGCQQDECRFIETLKGRIHHMTGGFLQAPFPDVLKQDGVLILLNVEEHHHDPTFALVSLDEFPAGGSADHINAFPRKQVNDKLPVLHDGDKHDGESRAEPV